jgi:hypothetical protein
VCLPLPSLAEALKRYDHDDGTYWYPTKSCLLKRASSFHCSCDVISIGFLLNNTAVRIGILLEA